MARPKKTYKIKRGRPKSPKPSKLTEANCENSEDEMSSEKDLPDVFDAAPQKIKEDAPIKGVVKMDPRNISNLSD